MNSLEIYQAFETISRHSSKKDKVSLLKKYLQSKDFKAVIQYMLDPRLTYGISNLTINKVKGSFGKKTWQPVDIHNLLSMFATRALTGTEAVIALHDHHTKYSAESWDIFCRILTKTPDIGATAKLINEAYPGVVWTFDCMLAHPYEDKRVKTWPIAAEPKIDGVRVIAPVDNGQCSGLYSRRGIPFPAFDFLRPKIDRLFRGGSFILDGEMTAGDIFNVTVGSARRLTEDAKDAVYNLFDIVPMNVWLGQAQSTPYLERRELLTKYAKGKVFPMIPMKLCHNHDEIEEYYQEQRELGFEGIILKEVNHLYVKKRSHSWMKIKAQNTMDVKITGFLRGDKGKYQDTLGRIKTSHKNNKGEYLKVGGGFSDELRDEIWHHKRKYVGMVAEIEYNELTPDGSLRHPRLHRLRPDKDID